MPRVEVRPRTEYQPGDRVRHEHFGEGVVVSAREQRGDTEVTVAFEGQGVKRLMLNFAPLTKVSAREPEHREVANEVGDSVFEQF